MASNSSITDGSAQVGLNVFNNVGGAPDDGAAFSVTCGAVGSARCLIAPKQPANATGFLPVTSIGVDSASARSAAGALADANEARESATLHALQTQQQRATASLSTAEQAPAWLMKLFR